MTARAALTTLHLVSTLASLAGGGLGGRGDLARSNACPQCQLGKLIRSKTGARYCHRCSYFKTKNQ